MQYKLNANYWMQIIVTVNVGYWQSWTEETDINPAADNV